jgi:hypothetical protein
LNGGTLIGLVTAKLRVSEFDWDRKMFVATKTRVAALKTILDTATSVELM